MKILWKIEDGDVQKIKEFYNQHKNNNFVLNRIERNIKKKVIPEVSKENFWEAMISCLLTTQQRVGPESQVTKFICTNPFLLNYNKCKISNNIKMLVEETITNFRGIRRANSIGEESEFNFHWLEKVGWRIIMMEVEKLKNNQSAKTERKSAEIIIDNLKGFGPKQARNLLQSLGLTKFEIPLDSRITKWLNDFEFPIKLSATALSDKNYYNFILDGFQKICKKCNIYPCVMDAVIFASFDKEWPNNKLRW